MKRYNSTLIKMTRRLGMAIAALLMLSTMASCSDQDPQTSSAFGEEAYLNLSFSTATNTTTRAGGSENLGTNETKANPDSESDIHNIKVWVFKTGSDDDAHPIAAKEDTPPAVDGKPVNGNYTLSLKFLRKMNNKDVTNIDLYILANSESTNANLKGKTLYTITRKDLKELTFNSPFGIKDDGSGSAETTDVPANGLPISRAITNIDVNKFAALTEAEAQNKSITIPLVRAVSKLHFFFARKKGKDTESVTVTKIEVNGETLTAASPVFPEETTDADKNTKGLTGSFNGLTYLNRQILKFGEIATSKIKDVNDPKYYIRKDGEEAQKYMTRLSTGGVKEGCKSYLRETDKPITGTIYFKLSKNGAEKHKTFSISKAYRNHEMVVYGYFLGDKESTLTLKYYVADWNVKDATDITFN